MAALCPRPRPRGRRPPAGAAVRRPCAPARRSGGTPRGTAPYIRRRRGGLPAPGRARARRKEVPVSRPITCTILGLLALAGPAGAAPAPAATVSIDDFEDRDLVAGRSSAWIPLGDDLLGGTTTLRLKPIRGGAHGSRGALRLEGTIRARSEEHTSEL